MKRVTFVTGNSWNPDEARRLLAGVDVTFARLNLAKPPGDLSLEETAAARARDAWSQLRAPCLVENTGMYLDDHRGEPGTRTKRLLRELGEEGFAARYGGSRGVTRVVVAWVDEGEVTLYEGRSEGELLAAPRGTGGYGWDRLWVPAGYDRTLAELATSKYLVNMRELPFLQLTAALRGDGFAGVFESHVTVAPCDEAAFADACRALGLKFVRIELPKGDHAVQPMTAGFHRGGLAEVIGEVHGLARELVRRGFTVTRTKVEAVGRHRDVPLTDEAARRAPAQNYFEHHVKVALPAGHDLDALAARCRALDAHLSRNARKRGADGVEERFITVRSYGVGQGAADARCDRVEALARELGLPVRHRVREYTVYDASIEVDRNWMTP